MNPDFWKGRRVLVTGHTGFKGGWLCLFLKSLGAEIYGVALPPVSQPSLFEVAHVGAILNSTLHDIRDLTWLKRHFQETRPEVVFHLAAQPLVRTSYINPVETYEVNVMGTAHVLEASRGVPELRAVVVVTSDKCYDNREWEWGYREIDPMGGHDPYSSSKGCAELVTAAYARSFFQEAGSTSIATARAGNVIGGGGLGCRPADPRCNPRLFRWRGTEDSPSGCHSALAACP